MMRLIGIELKKLTTYRVFWIMAILYALAVFFVFFGFPSLIDYFSMRSESTEIKLLKNFVYNFPDVWQNLSWVASLRFFIKIMLGMIFIILITNEYGYQTIRMSIINGMSRFDFLKGKIWLIVLFSFVATLIVFISGLSLGLMYSSSTSFSLITRKLIYLGGYFIEVFAYLSFALMLGILLKRTGFAIGVLFIYPIIEIIVQQKISDNIAPFLPINAMNQILKTPNTSLIQYSSPSNEIELQTYIATQDVLVCILYAVVFLALTYSILRKRDL